MAQYHSEEDVENENLEAFGPTLGPLYNALEKELTWLHAKRLEYKADGPSERDCDLFLSHRSRRPLARRAASHHTVD